MDIHGDIDPEERKNFMPTMTSPWNLWSITDNAVEPGSSTDDYNYYAWNVHHVSRYEQFRKQALYTDPPQQRFDFMNITWDVSLQSTRAVRCILEPGAESFSQDTNGDVCWRCNRIDFQNMVQNVSNFYDSAYALGQFAHIVRSADCPICGLLGCLLQEYGKARRQDDTCFYLTAFPTSALYGDAWTWKGPPDGVEETISFSLLTEATFRDQSKFRQPLLVHAIGFISPVVEGRDISRFQARRLGEEVDVAIINAWLNYCSHHHLASCTSAESPLHPSTRVINCNSKEVVPFESDYTYLALSYVWGDPKDSNAEDDRASGYLDTNYPQTVNDAITLAKELGFCYLWVDRFCISQDDVPERQIQIAQMDRIYAGAEATIIAAAGDDPHYGLPGITKRSSHKSCYTTINGQIHTVVPPDPSNEIRASRWNSRAWTYQESMLSKRRIIFCDRQVYFECSAMHCYEAMQAPVHLLHSSLCSRFSEWNEPGLFPVEQHRHALDHLFHHLALYTVRELSYPNDILNGMLGIFGAFTQQPVAARVNRGNRRIMQIAGIPIVPNDTLIKYDPIDPPVYHLTREGQFITGLGWKLSALAQRRPSFPSWSWTGWYGAVEPRNNYEGYIRNTHRLELEFDVSNHAQDTPSALDLRTILNAYHKKDLAPNYIPSLTVTGETLAVRVIRAPVNLHPHIDPTSFIASMDTEDNGFYVADSFFLTHADSQLLSGGIDYTLEGCIGLILGMAQVTYFAGDDKRTRVLDDYRFPCMILVLREKEGTWERLGLIEHEIRIRTDSNPIPVGSGYLGLRTERRRLKLT